MVPLVHPLEGTVAELPLLGRIDVHVLADVIVVEEGVDALVVDAVVVSGLVQTVLEQVVDVRSRHLEVRSNAVLPTLAFLSTQRAVSTETLIDLRRNEEVVAKGTDCKLADGEG